MLHDIIDYGASEFRVPSFNDITKFLIAYCSPTRAIPSAWEHGHHLSRKSAFLALPQIERFLTVMSVYNPKSSWLPAARHLAMKMSASSMTSHPLEISGTGGATASSAHNVSSGEDHPLPNIQPSQTHEGVQGDGEHVHFSPSTLQLAGSVGTTGGSGRGPQPIGHNATP